ncbi:MAG TPA: PQQ-binding-like beta-propeller repeat protein [Thermoplasmata archaeon]|nr:PQQ-binding-like beta-propeller repeat protein [Thermoplasmata archaeon]
MDVRTRAIGAILVAVVLVLATVVAYRVLVTSHSGGGPGPAGLASCPSGPGSESAADWPTYHRDSQRDGALAIAPVANAATLWPAPPTLDGQVYAEPLACGTSVFVATEDDSVYAVNASTGAIEWHTHLGTPVDGATLPCGDIDPTGITGTPVIDASSGTLYAVAFLAPAQHVLFGLDLRNGTVTYQRTVDPAGADASVEQQRGALALAGSTVYIPYGGLAGDCAAYHGWVVGVPLGGNAPLLAYQVPTHREGGIWAPGGITVAPDGDLLVSTGNGDSNTTYDSGDSVIELSPSLTELDYFAPVDWAQLNVHDTDLGSVSPTILPDGDLFQIGKAGVGYLLSGTHLGGIGGQLFTAQVCGAAFGATAQSGGTLLVPCTNGLSALHTTSTNFTVVWSAPGFDCGPPIVTGDVVWVVDLGHASLLGFNLTTGHPRFSFSLLSVDHFVTPSAAPGTVFVAAGDVLQAFGLS